MRKAAYLFALAGAFSTLALADDWSGRLIDATCYNQQKRVEACDATSTTTSFMLSANGKAYALDATGNTQAAAALKNRADRTDPAQKGSKEIMAKVSGMEKNGTIAVTKIDVQ